MEWKDVIYGPVKSRRLGQSLGINLTPLELNVCNFNCGYCRVGVSSKGNANTSDFNTLGWTPERIQEAISSGLQYHEGKSTPIDYLTIAGNGEPTLYPLFALVVEYLITQKSRYLSHIPTAIFTNATTLSRHDVKEAVYQLDRRFFKFDAGDERTFRRINLPIGVTYREVVQNICSLDNFELSIAVTNGEVSNYESFFNPEFIDTLRKMRFTRIFLYDIDIPKTTFQRFNVKTERKKLESLAQHLSEKLNLQLNKEVVILWHANTRENNITLYPQQTN